MTEKDFDANILCTIIELLVIFFLLICIGLTFDIVDKYIKYGWYYEVTTIINDVANIQIIYIGNNLYFVIFFWFFFVITFYALILINRIKKVIS